MDYPPSEPISPIGGSDIDGPNGLGPSSSLPFLTSAFGPPTEASVAAFLRLPAEVVLRILYSVDADGFASLSLLNRNWYKQSQKQELYAHHLSRCPSYALCNTVITGPFRRNDLYRLKAKFAAEVRRNLFEAYMRPRRTLINLISVNANSSAAFPGGEAFRFAFSPNGQTVLALSSSRIYVLDVTTDNVVVRKELKTLRRPIAASITDDGSLLAVLSSRHQVNIYGLTPEGPKHLQVLALNDPPRTIALAHEGTVLAAAYEGLVEVFSLAANALSTDRRAVRSEAMDTLQFSGDGSMLVGSSQSLDEPNAVVITAPFYTENDPDLSSREIHSRMWTTQILFPQISSVCSHAELLQGHMEGDATWLFAYDHSLMSYRAVRTDDTRTGVAYFLNPPTNRRFSLPSPSTAPTASACGTLVASGFAGSGMWLYGVPERLDTSPDMGSVVERHEERMRGGVHLTTATGHMEPLMAYSPSVSGSSDEMEGLDSLAQKVDWRQSLFVKCRGVNSLDGCSAAKWIERPEGRQFGFPGKRLVVVAPGGVNAFGEELGEESMPVDGSRICLLDFDYAPTPLEDREITIEVGDNVPELLTEATGDIDSEVALERRRTVRGPAARGAGRGSLGRSQTASSPPGQGFFSSGRVRRPSASQPSSPSEGMNTPPVQPPVTNLQRSNTSGGYRAARFPPRPPLGQDHPPGSGAVQPNGPGRRPSEDSWETPPPPYSSGGQGHTPTASPFQNWPQLPNGATSNQYGGPSMYPQPLRVGQGQQANAPGQFAGYQNGALLPPRSRGPHLATVSESAIPRQSHVPGPFAGISPVNTGSPAGTSNRPSPEETAPVMTARMSQPISPPTPHGTHGIPVLFPPPEMQPPKPSSAGGLTLTGANLQNRLNHPVPPTPPPPGSRDQQRSVSAPFSQAQSAGFGFAGPTPDQMSNLERRVSQTQIHRRPLDPRTNGTGQQLAPVPPSPPRGAWGATGVPGSPSFNRAITTPNGLSRSGSRGSNISIPTSSSTPNLHAGMRPKYGRLDTIESMGSQADAQGPIRMRAHSVEEAIPSPVREQLTGLYDERRIGTDPPTFVPRPKKKKKAKSEGWSGQSEAGTSQGPGKKRGTRCVVM